jgi:receptor protein-tyrosine kinase
VSDGPRYVTFGDYLRVVRQRRVLIIVVTLLFGAAALLLSIGQDSQYETEASLEYKDENVDTSVLGTLTSTGAQTAEQRSAIASETFKRLDIAREAAKLLGADADPDALSRAVSAQPEARTNLVVVRFRWPDPRYAKRGADAFAQAAVNLETERAKRRYLEGAKAQRQVVKALGKRPEDRFARSLALQQAARLEQVAKIVRPVELVRRAAVPVNPVAPQPIRNTVLGLILGLTFALIAAFARDSLDRRFKSSREISEELRMPLLGFVPDEIMGRTVVANGRKALDASELEGFRILRTNVEFLDVDNTPKLVLVTSALPEEGKSTVSTALACAYASAGKRTMLVECDLRRPTLADRLKLQPRPGLTDYLLRAASPGEVMQNLQIELPRLHTNGGAPAPEADKPLPLVVVTAGSPTPQPAELLRSQRAKAFFEQVTGVYDVVIVDTSPLLSVADALELLPAADAVIVCVRASKTTRDQARAARAALDHFPERPRGVVVTGIRKGELADSYGYYSYAYGYERA